MRNFNVDHNVYYFSLCNKQDNNDERNKSQVLILNIENAEKNEQEKLDNFQTIS